MFCRLDSYNSKNAKQLTPLTPSDIDFQILHPFCDPVLSSALLLLWSSLPSAPCHLLFLLVVHESNICQPTCVPHRHDVQSPTTCPEDKSATHETTTF